jgi:hypothetical protein
VTGDERDRDAVSDDDIFRECAERFRMACDAESANRVKAIDDLQFVNGEQWPNDLYRLRSQENRPALTINHTETFVSRIINNLKQQRPRIKSHPVGDGADIQTSEVLNGLIRHIETASQASYAYDTGGAAAVRAGWGYWRIMAEYLDEQSFDQELKIQAVQNAFTGYIDPASVMPDGSDMRWFIFSGTMKRIEYKRLYPKADNAEWSLTGAGDELSDWESKEEIRLAEYFRIVERSDTLHQMADGTTRLASQLPSPEVMIAAGYEFARDKSGRPITRPSCSRQIEWYRINGCKIVDRRVLPGRWIPVVRCEGNTLDINGQVERKGMVRSLRDPARMTNYWRSAETEMIALAPKAPWVGAEGQFDGHPEWNDANTRTYSRLEYKPITGPDGSTLPMPQRTQPAGIAAGAVNAAQGAYNDLLSVAGMPNEPNQDTRGTVVSGKALQRRQGLTDNTHYQYYDNQVFSIAHTGRILLDLIPYYYDTERIQRIIREDGKAEMVKLNEQQKDPMTQAVLNIKNNLQVGRYDVVIDAGPGYQTKREEGADAMIGILGTPLGEEIAKTSGDLVLRAQDFPYAEEIADRLMALNPTAIEKTVEGMPKQAQTIIGALQKQMQVQQQTIQELQAELKYKVSVEQGWMHVEREKSQLNAETKVHDTQIRAHTARDVAEITSAAKLLNTEQEARHNREAAQRLLQAGEKAANH